MYCNIADINDQAGLYLISDSIPGKLLHESREVGEDVGNLVGERRLWDIGLGRVEEGGPEWGG